MCLNHHKIGAGSIRGLLYNVRSERDVTGDAVNKIKPQLPSGMRDFLPADVLRRQYVMDTVANVFQTYGYEPLQTPVLELLSGLPMTP